MITNTNTHRDYQRYKGLTKSDFKNLPLRVRNQAQKHIERLLLTHRPSTFSYQRANTTNYESNDQWLVRGAVPTESALWGSAKRKYYVILNSPAHACIHWVYSTELHRGKGILHASFSSIRLCLEWAYHTSAELPVYFLNKARLRRGLPRAAVYTSQPVAAKIQDGPVDIVDIEYPQIEPAQEKFEFTNKCDIFAQNLSEPARERSVRVHLLQILLKTRPDLVHRHYEVRNGKWAQKTRSAAKGARTGQ